MPHVKINIPVKVSDGRELAQGQTTYVSSADARNIVKDNRGKIVKLPTKEILAIARREREANAPAAEPARVSAPPEQPAPDKAPARRAPVKKDEDG